MAEPADEKLHPLIRSMEEVESLTTDADGLMHIESKCDIHQALTRMLMEHGYDISLLRQRGGDLDEIYRRFFEKAGEQNERTDKNETTKTNFWRRFLPRKEG